MKKYLLGIILFILLGQGIKADTPPPPDEGMWLPMLVERLNYTDMKKLGLHLTADELYSINHSSLKDAIVSMGFFCTGELVSDKGLYLTNHHCGYGTIQANSTIEHDYLTDGFWAKTYDDELPMEGLTVYILNYMDDVTGKILSEVSDTMSEDNRAKTIRKAISKLKEEKSSNGKYRVDIKGFFDGNEYYMFVYHQYKDVRLVGAPPESIGKFGGDTDNWMWPRHTGDFSMFRIYTAPDGSAATYSKNNIPFKPAHFLPVSLKGVKKNDFAMIWGYPGSTDRYMTSYGVQDMLDRKAPTIVDIRDHKLKVMKKHMKTDPAIRIKAHKSLEDLYVNHPEKRTPSRASFLCSKHLAVHRNDEWPGQSGICAFLLARGGQGQSLGHPPHDDRRDGHLHGRLWRFPPGSRDSRGPAGGLDHRDTPRDILRFSALFR